MIYEAVTDDALFAVGAVWTPEACTGFVARDGDRIMAVAAAYVADDGRWWSAVKIEPGCPPCVHREVVRTLQALADAGVPAVWAMIEEGVVKAEPWMRRLGFEPHANGEWCLGLDIWSSDRRRRLGNGSRRRTGSRTCGEDRG